MKIEDLRDWLDVEILEADEIKATMQQKGKDTDYSDWDNEVDRLNQIGFCMALEFVRRQL